MSRFQYYRQHAIAKRNGYVTYPLDYHQFKNYDKIYNEKTGLYALNTVHNSSVVESKYVTEPEEAYQEIKYPHVVENDITKINEEQEYDMKDGILIPPKYK